MYGHPCVSAWPSRVDLTLHEVGPWQTGPMGTPVEDLTAGPGQQRVDDRLIHAASDLIAARQGNENHTVAAAGPRRRRTHPHRAEPVSLHRRTLCRADRNGSRSHRNDRTTERDRCRRRSQPWRRRSLWALSTGAAGLLPRGGSHRPGQRVPDAGTGQAAASVDLRLEGAPGVPSTQ